MAVAEIPIGYFNKEHGNLICGRCHTDTGNRNQGHYWAWCGVSHENEEFHFCCPDDCELYPETDNANR